MLSAVCQDHCRWHCLAASNIYFIEIYNFLKIVAACFWFDRHLKRITLMSSVRVWKVCQRNATSIVRRRTDVNRSPALEKSWELLSKATLQDMKSRWTWFAFGCMYNLSNVLGYLILIALWNAKTKFLRIFLLSNRSYMVGIVNMPD